MISRRYVASTQLAQIFNGTIVPGLGSLRPHAGIVDTDTVLSMPLTFRDLSFDAAARRVARAGREIKLTRKAFDLLSMLVERRPEAVSKDDIHARLWPDTFVAEITLHSLISEIRRAIGDDSNDPQFIRTVHGFGYAFIADSHREQAPSGHRRVRGWLIWNHERLQVFDGDNVFGRGDADVVELPSTTVSRRHARISFDEDPWLEDLGSKNGTFIGEHRVTSRVRLNDGDRVRLGSFLLTFRVAQPPDATATQSSSDIPGISK